MPKLSCLSLTVSVRQKTFLTEKQTGKDKLKKVKRSPGLSQHTVIITPNKIQRLSKLPIVSRLNVSAEVILSDFCMFVLRSFTRTKRAISPVKTC